MPTGVIRSVRRTSSASNFSIRSRHSPTFRTEERKSRSSLLSVVFLRPTIRITQYHTTQLFQGKWFNIKQLIGIAKEAKLRNSAPIKYHIEIANSFWNNIFKVEGIYCTVSSSRSVSTRKRTTSSTSSPAWRTAERCSSPRSMFHPMVRSSMTWSSTK